MLLPNSSKTMFILRLFNILRRNHRFPQIYLTWLTTISEKPCANGIQIVYHISIVFEGFILNNSIGSKKDPPRRAPPQPWPHDPSLSHTKVCFFSPTSCLIPSDPASPRATEIPAPLVCLLEQFHFLSTSSMTSPRSLHPSSPLGL